MIDHRARRVRRPTATLATTLAALLATLAALFTAACDTDNGVSVVEETASSTPTPTSMATDTPIGPGSPTPQVSPTGTTTTGATPDSTGEATPPEEEPDDPLVQIRRNLLSNLTLGLEPGSSLGALDDIEVVTAELVTPDRELWIAVTSGPGIYELPEQREHVVAVYERAGADWVELSNATLASAPTFAELEVVADNHAGSSWIAVHGVAGAHGGTFELLEFDGVVLTSTLWWFSSMPGAGDVVDLDGAEPPEIVLNATDPYVYCYACGVSAWDEVIYRWMDGDLVEVPLAAIEDADQVITDLTEVAARSAQADLWRHAIDAADEALEQAPDNIDVWWLHTLIQRVAEARLEHAGAEQQPFMTNVLAGEYDAAVDLMRPYVPEVALTADGPLVAGTVAEDGWEEATAIWVLDYTERALDVAPEVAAAHAVRAYGLLLDNSEDWAGALEAMEGALLLEPNDTFYQEATEYLLLQSGMSAE